MPSTITIEDAHKSIDLMEGEEVLHITGRHVVLLLTRLLAPLSVILIAALIAFYRAIGGGFMMLSGQVASGMDLLNQVLIYLAVGLGLAWIQSRLAKPKQSRTRMFLAGSVILILAIVYFRNRGGQLFFLDPLAMQAFDPINIALYIVMALGTIGAIYTFLDWSNDELILTNQRVIYDNDTVLIPKLIERRVQLQLAIDDIQNVTAKTDTYTKHWLNFGTLIVQSATAERKIIFDSASKPALMQEKIMGEVKKLQGKRSEKGFEAMVEAQVYKSAVEKTPIKFRFRVEHKRIPSYLTWLLIENPFIEEAKATITWHPHWIKLLQAVVGPFGLLFLGVFLIVMGSRLEAFGSLGVIGWSVLLLIIFVAWMAWEIEDHRNDKYILTPTNIIDIDKKPFGPEDRRTASLGAVQNVSFKTTFISNLIGYGDVLIETAGTSGKFTFTHVPQPREVVAQVNEYLAEFKRGEKERNLNDTLTLLRHYHEAQKRHNEINIPPPTTS